MSTSTHESALLARAEAAEARCEDYAVRVGQLTARAEHAELRLALTEARLAAVERAWLETDNSGVRAALGGG